MRNIPNTEKGDTTTDLSPGRVQVPADGLPPMAASQRQLNPLQVRIQLPLVDSGTQTDVVCGGSGDISPSVLLNPYAYKQIPITAYYTPPSPDPEPSQNFSYNQIPTVKMAPIHEEDSPVVFVDTTQPLLKGGFSGVDNTENVNMLVVGNKQKQKTKKERSTLSSYFVALRPWSFPVSISPVVLGTCLVVKSQSGAIDFNIMFATVLTVLSVHAAGNLVNTYYDFKRGIDNKKSDDRTLVDSILKPNDVVTLGALLYVAGCVGFVLLAYLSPARMEHLALIYFCGLSSSFLYTGGLGLKYIALGDIPIVLTFGPITVLFTYLAQTGHLSLGPLVYAIPLALHTEACLHANNARDAESDRQAGAVTLAILLGKGGSYCLFCCLLFTPFLMFFTAGIHYSRWMFLPAALVLRAFRLEKEFRRCELTHMPQSVAQLSLGVGVFYASALLLADTGDILPMFNV